MITIWKVEGIRYIQGLIENSTDLKNISSVYKGKNMMHGRSKNRHLQN
jgi:hypothetical protein